MPFYLRSTTDNPSGAGTHRGVTFGRGIFLPSPSSAVFLAIILFLGGMTVAIATGQMDGVPPGQQVTR